MQYLGRLETFNPYVLAQLISSALDILNLPCGLEESCVSFMTAAE